MSKVLYIKASPRGSRSKSSTVADTFLEVYKNQNPDDVIDTLNVFEGSLPQFDGLRVQAKYTILHGKEHSKEELDAWKEVEQVIESFKSADNDVLSIPMWHFNIPYKLTIYSTIYIALYIVPV